MFLKYDIFFKAVIKVYYESLQLYIFSLSLIILSETNLVYGYGKEQP